MAAEHPDVEGPVLSVSELNTRVKHLLEHEPDLRDVWVRGELSGWRGPHHTSGHCYFRLKDDQAEIDAVMWRSSFARLAFDPEDGMAVLARGQPTLYEARGRYQLVLSTMVPAGLGDLAVRLQLLKAKLEREGLFAPERKRRLPAFPLHVGIVTSKGAAALQDVLNVLRRRSPHVHALLAPCSVQGEGAAATVAAAVQRLNAYAARAPLDVILVVRGGGSLEDLWAFNEEVAVRAVAASRVPVVSGVGHETDWTLIDLAADVRAPTPSAAAELAVPSREDALAGIADRRRQLAGRMSATLRHQRTRLDGLARRPVLSRPEALFAAAWQHTDELAGRLPRAVTVRLDRAADRVRGSARQLPRATRVRLDAARARLSKDAATLDALSPLKVLGRGYAVAQREGRAVRSVEEVAEGDGLDVRVTDGTISATVLSVKAADAAPGRGGS